MNLSDLSIKNPVFAVMLSAAMIVFGYLGYRDMGVSQFPEIDFPVISVVITREKAPPDIMDGDVTDVVEDAVAGVEGVNYIISKSLESTSVVTVYFHLSRNIDAAMTDVQNAVLGARRRLPKDIDEPVIAKVNPNQLPVLWLTLSASGAPGATPISLNRISDFAEKEFKQQLAAIRDVGGVQFAGLRSRNIVIHYSAAKLAAMNKTPDDLAEAVRREHVEMPAGIIESRLVEANFRIKGEAGSIKELDRLIISPRSLQQVHLRDVAVAEDGTEEPRTLARFNRMPAVAVGVRKAIGGNLVAVCENVKAELPRLTRMLPDGVELHVPVDYSVFVRENVDELKLTLFLGIVLTAGVCFLFLGSLGTTINICLSIPTSLIGTFFVLNYGVKLFGLQPFTINLMTLLALSLSVGVVVDDAILVLENIYRHREMGKPRKQAALVGAREIAFAAIAATLSIMAIFLPVAFMTGTIGKFFFQFGLTVAVAVFLSLICALTLTPMLCAFFLNLHQKHLPRPLPFGLPLAAVIGLGVVLVTTSMRVVGLWSFDVDAWAWPLLSIFDLKFEIFDAPWFRWPAETLLEFGLVFALVRWGNLLYWALDRFLLGPLLIRPTDWALTKLTAGYAASLRFALRLWPVVLAGSVALIGLAAWMIHADVLGRELVPSEDQSRFVVHVICPVGSNLQYVSDRLAKCEQKLEVRDDVASFLTTVATEKGELINEADVFVQLVPQDHRAKKQQRIMQEVRALLEQVPDVRVVVRDQSTEGFTAQRGDPVDFAVQGDWRRLPEVANKITREMARRGGVQDIDTDYRPGMPEVRIYPNREKMALVNMTMAHLANSLSLHVGGQRVAMYTDAVGGRRYDLRIRGQLPERASPDQIKTLLLRAGNNQLVPLGDVAEVQIVSTLPVITRFNHQRKIEITANPDTAAGVSQGEAILRCQRIAEEALPEGFRVVELGNAQAMRETITSLAFALVLGIIIAYMILGVQFNSFVHPFTVLLAMPFAVTGALVTLWLTGDTLNMMSMIGLILLMGLVKKNSIILVDYINQLRREGLGVYEAVLKACPIRLRPILMTSVATVAGAIPAAVGLGPGAETRAPMARAIIGGIVLSTLVTLILVPVFYVLIERLRVAANRLVEAPPADDEPLPQPAPVAQPAASPTSTAIQP